MVKTMDAFIKKVFDKQNSISKIVTVAQDGSGNYKKVQEALNAVPANNKNKFIIYVRNGVYYEKLFLDSTKDFVTIIGENKFKTILTYNDHTGKLSQMAIQLIRGHHGALKCCPMILQQKI
jgi:pectinesterase